MRMSRLGVIGAVIAAGVLVPTGVAQAAPTGCSITPAQWSASAKCTGGTGTVTAHVMCSDWYNGGEFRRSGRAVPPGQVSTATCPQKIYIGVSDYWYTTAG